MTEKPTLEDQVEANNSFLKNIWSKGKYLVAVLGAAYAIHGGYHLVQAWNKDGERLDLVLEDFPEFDNTNTKSTPRLSTSDLSGNVWLMLSFFLKSIDSFGLFSRNLSNSKISKPMRTLKNSIF